MFMEFVNDPWTQLNALTLDALSNTLFLYSFLWLAASLDASLATMLSCHIPSSIRK